MKQIDDEMTFETNYFYQLIDDSLLFLIQDRSHYFINVINSSKRQEKRESCDFFIYKTILINISKMHE